MPRLCTRSQSDFAKGVLVVGGLVVAVTSASRAQQADAAALPSFEVASIKLSDPGLGRPNISIAGRTFTTRGFTLQDYVRLAYDVPGFQITGGPGWIKSERYDITAKAEAGYGNLTVDNMRPLIRSLLAERFQLVIHRETKELPVYALVVAKNGARLQANAGAPGPQVNGGRGQLRGIRVNMSLFVAQLRSQVGRTVVDRTGLKGEYDYTLQWTPEPGQLRPPGVEAPSPDANGPSIFTALQEQLGLRLESTKGPVETIVIDRAERASEN
jgi:uncharacterized protein (TIGR03435 family)